jgi:DsbC/DsbD-like thiol-disulfide interchange protein
MADSIHETSVHGSAQGLQISARLDGSTSRASSSTCVAVDITIDPGLHIYGLPVPDGFIPLSVDVGAPSEVWRVGPPVFPPPTPRQMEGFDESFFIYEEGLSVSIPLTCTGKGSDAVLAVKVRYQACGERGCFMPQTIELNLPIPG